MKLILRAYKEGFRDASNRVKPSVLTWRDSKTKKVLEEEYGYSSIELKDMLKAIFKERLMNDVKT